LVVVSALLAVGSPVRLRVAVFAELSDIFELAVVIVIVIVILVAVSPAVAASAASAASSASSASMSTHFVGSRVCGKCMALYVVDSIDPFGYG